MSVEKTYTEATIDVNLANTIWALLDYIEHTSDPIEMVSISAVKNDNGKTEIHFGKYEPGMEEKDDNMVAAIGVTPFKDADVEVDDYDLNKAMQFMYFYQAVYSSVSKFEMGQL